MQKIILTGATSPVGSVIYNNLKNKFNVLKISKSLGWNICNITQQHEVIKETEDAFALINCAHVEDTQSVLLDKSNAEINISISSLITDLIFNQASELADIEYIKNKLLLEHVHKQKNNSALIKISSFGPNEIVPNITESQLLDPILKILSRKIKLPVSLKIHNGFGTRKPIFID